MSGVLEDGGDVGIRSNPKMDYCTMLVDRSLYCRRGRTRSLAFYAVCRPMMPTMLLLLFIALRRPTRPDRMGMLAMLRALSASGPAGTCLIMAVPNMPTWLRRALRRTLLTATAGVFVGCGCSCAQHTSSTAPKRFEGSAFRGLLAGVSAAHPNVLRC